MPDDVAPADVPELVEDDVLPPAVPEVLLGAVLVEPAAGVDELAVVVDEPDDDDAFEEPDDDELPEDDEVPEVLAGAELLLLDVDPLEEVPPGEVLAVPVVVLVG